MAGTRPRPRHGPSPPSSLGGQISQQPPEIGRGTGTLPPATLRVPPPVWRNWQTQRIQNPPPPKGLQVRFLSPASDPAPLRAGRWRCGLRRGGGLGFLLGLWTDCEKHENHANRGGYRLRGEREILFRKINCGGVEAEKDGAAGNKAVFHTGRDSARCGISWQWRFDPMHAGFCV